MNRLSLLVLAGFISGCTTIHFRSKNSVPVVFDGNPSHKKEVSISGRRDFFFWGLSPEHHEVFIDEEVRKAGYAGLSKAIVYEHKSAQDTLISFLTFGLYLPRGYTISGYTSNVVLPEELPDLSQ